MNLISSWSGGKDSCYALMCSTLEGHTPVVLLNMMNENGKISRSHGLPLSIIQQQAKAMGTALCGIPATWNDYELNFIETLKNLKQEYQIEGVVFGDIDLEPHREWEEKVCNTANLKTLLPLWKQNRKELVYAMIDSGIRAIIVSCNTFLGETYLGREITKELVEELENIGVDACGENGEYHTVVIDCPLFSKPLILPEYKTKTYENYCFIIWN
ncbi:MAG: diphthine--ammonia ligase [Flavobacteriia bacterium]|nr:diphthine--ammonia ligase [Flavobacteriia bacterium]